MKEKAEKLFREAIRRAFRAGINGSQVLTWVYDELVNEVDGGRKRR